MEILRKINNNVALARGENGVEFVVVGKGVGFPKMPYALENPDGIDQFFVDMVDPQLRELFAQLPADDVLLAKEIIDYGKRVLGKNLSDAILLTLSDHLHHAFERQKNGVELKNPLTWGIRRMYAKEIDVGEKALEMIWRSRGVRLPYLETVFIALHFINAQLEKKTPEAADETADRVTIVVDEMLSVVKQYHPSAFEEDSMNFTRFVTHLQYFVLRQIENAPLAGESDALYQAAKEEYADELNCIDRVENLLRKKYNWTCTNDEKFYLALHLRRLLGRKINRKTDCH